MNIKFGLDNVITQYFNTASLKTYFLHFSKGESKYKEFIEILIEALLEFVFGLEEVGNLSSSDIDKFIDACDLLFSESSNKKREGVLGELILHSLLREYLDTIPFTGRITFINDNGTPAKGYDIIQLAKDHKTLVLGESKMFGPFQDKNKGVLITDNRVPKKALDALASDIKNHFNVQYMKSQFIHIEKKAVLENKELKANIADPTREKIREWKNKLRTAQSLDSVVDHIFVPLLCAYSCEGYFNHTEVSESFIIEYESRINELTTYFENKKIEIPECLSIILILFPVPCKDELIEQYYAHIKEGASQ